MTTFSCSYSADDDKLRISASSRLDAETYARVKAAGFGWAPKQEVFYAVWSPSRESLALELAGEIDDEDTSLVERAETRAERFEEYGEHRADDAAAAHKAVSAICDGIPMGQPILVGHHSEKHARRDAEKIENGMRRAVKMWETSQYWQQRAAGAIHAAKYKELPAVRARRIKGLEADLRSYVASYTRHANQPDIMQHDGYGDDTPMVPYAWVGPHGRGGHWVKASSLSGIEAGAQRWLQHIENRLIYERAMLAEGGGLKADGFDIQLGGRILRRGEWFIVTKLNKQGGVLNSVSVMGHWASTVPIEEIKDYRAPAEGDAEKVAAVTKLAPLCNYPGEGFRHVAKDGMKKSYSTWIHTFPATETHGAYRSYSTFKGGGGLDCHDRMGIFFTDQKRKDPPALTTKPEPVKFAPVPVEDIPERPIYHAPAPTEFDTMRDALRSGVAVQVVSAPQLFPTPAELARKMVAAAGIMGGERVLEPSAGTGNIVRAIFNGFTGADNGRVVAVEINASLVEGLRQQQRLTVGANDATFDIRQGDFLACNGDLGKFDAVIMNPPFSNAADIKHITHAVTFLKPGGRLVAICANGPRQREALMPLAENSGGYWEDLPAGTFDSAGTGVNTAMVVIEG